MDYNKCNKYQKDPTGTIPEVVFSVLESKELHNTKFSWTARDQQGQFSLHLFWTREPVGGYKSWEGKKDWYERKKEWSKESDYESAGKRHKPPSAIRRDKARMEAFLARKRAEAAALEAAQSGGDGQRKVTMDEMSSLSKEWSDVGECKENRGGSSNSINNGCMGVYRNSGHSNNNIHSSSSNNSNNGPQRDSSALNVEAREFVPPDGHGCGGNHNNMAHHYHRASTMSMQEIERNQRNQELHRTSSAYYGDIHNIERSMHGTYRSNEKHILESAAEWARRELNELGL